MTDNDVPMLEAKNLVVQFGSVTALGGVSLAIRPGRIVGLLGPNGSGKSTLLRTVVGLYLPTYGQCVTFGRDSAKLGPGELARIGYVHQEGELLEWMKVRQLVRYVAAYYPSWNTNLEQRYIREFEIDTDARVGRLSPGQRQRLAILLAICHEPELLLLDEPAAALDPVARGRFLDLLLKIIQDPRRTVIISSHILSDVEKVIDHVLILEKGRLVRDCPFDQLQEEFCAANLTALAGALPERLALPGIVECQRNGTQARLVLQNPDREHLETLAAEQGCQIEFRPLSLEDLYKYALTQMEQRPR